MVRAATATLHGGGGGGGGGLGGGGDRGRAIIPKGLTVPPTTDPSTAATAWGMIKTAGPTEHKVRPAPVGYFA